MVGHAGASQFRVDHGLEFPAVQTETAVPLGELHVGQAPVELGAPEPVLVDLVGREVVHQLAGHSPDIGFGDLTHWYSQRSTSTAKRTYQRPGRR